VSHTHNISVPCPLFRTQNQVMVALVGAAVFHGTFYPECHIVQLRIEYLVTGPEVAQVRWRDMDI